jgi:hypothetical protein
MHSPLLGHETDGTFAEVASGVETQADGPPVGSAELLAEPTSIRVHAVAEEHETLGAPPPGPTGNCCQADAPPVGFVEVTMSPPRSVAMQSWVVGQESPDMDLFSTPKTV